MVPKMEKENLYILAKMVVAIRTGRAAIGMSQQEFADKIGVAKSTVARIETLEVSPKADFVAKAMRLFIEMGVDVDMYRQSGVSIYINDLAISNAVVKIKDKSYARAGILTCTSAGDK